MRSFYSISQIKYFDSFICANFTKQLEILQDVFCVVKLATFFFICLSVFFYLIKLRRFYQILTETNKTFTRKLGEKNTWKKHSSMPMQTFTPSILTSKRM